MPPKPRQSALAARSRKAGDSDEDDYTPDRKKVAAAAPRIGSKRPRAPLAPPAKTHGKARGKAARDELEDEDDAVLYEEEGTEDHSGAAEQQDPEQEEWEEEEVIEIKPAKQSKRTSVVHTAVVQQALLQLQAEQQQKAQAKKRSKKAAKNKIDDIFDKGVARFEAAYEGEEGYLARKKTMQGKIAESIENVKQRLATDTTWPEATLVHQKAFEAFTAQLEDYMQDRQNILSAIGSAGRAVNRRTGILQDKIAAFKLQRDIEVEEAAAHIQEASDSTRFAKAIRHSLNWQ